MKNFLNISDISSQELRGIIEEAKIRKSKRKKLNKSAADLFKSFLFDFLVFASSIIFLNSWEDKSDIFKKFFI